MYTNVAVFYNGEYPDLYPEELKSDIKAQDKAQDKILEFCKEPREMSEIMKCLGYKNRRRFARDYIEPLLKQGVLIMTIPDKPTSRNQKYVRNI